MNGCQKEGLCLTITNKDVSTMESGITSLTITQKYWIQSLLFLNLVIKK